MRSVQRSFGTFRYWILGFALILGSSRLLTFRTGSLEMLCSYVLYPFLVAQHTFIVPVKLWFERWHVMHELEELVKRQHAELEVLTAENIQLQSSRAHMNAISELIDFKKRYSAHNALIAQVLFKNFSDQSHFFLIDAGSRAGVAPDMVVVYKSCLVGRISDVYPFYSKVMLITDPACKVSAFCVPTGAQGIHEGTGVLHETQLSFVSHLATFHENDSVVSSGDGLVFPKGFGLGRIIASELKGFQYTIKIKPFLNLRSLTHCCVLQKGAELIKDTMP